MLQNLLLTIRQEDGAQHVMPINESAPRPAKADQIKVALFHFHVSMRRHLPKLERSASADPIRLLDIGHGKWLIAPTNIGSQRWDSGRFRDFRFSCRRA